MKTLLVVGLIFAVSYLSTRLVFSTRFSLLGFRYLFFSGTEFLLLGYMIGPQGLGLIPAAITESLDPLIHLALGWALGASVLVAVTQRLEDLCQFIIELFFA